MAVVWPTPTNRPTGYTVTAADWNTHADNLNNLNTRLGEATGPNNVMTRLNTLELLTGQTGTTGVGNYTLGERLGTGVTTTSSPTSGTATAQLTSIRNNIGDRLSHGQIYTEIGALKTAVTGLTTTTNTLTTNQGTRGSNGTIYSEIEALKNNSGGGLPYAGGRWHAGSNIVVPANGAIINCNVAEGTVTGVTNSNGAVTVAQTGRYDMSGNIHFRHPASTSRNYWVWFGLSSGADTPRWGLSIFNIPSLSEAGFFAFSAAALNIPLTAGQSVAFMGFCAIVGAGNTTIATVDSHRLATNFAIRRVD